ncbi:MAG: hypothetical protein S4CHLAM102_06560 [Chlamydiia bacterium]|nr:hypothetical protein [Chlamydiia bacterium]
MPLVEVIRPTPIYNTSDTNRIYYGKENSLNFDDQNLVREIEYVALRGERFFLDPKNPVPSHPSLVQVQIPHYPSNVLLYVDSADLTLTDQPIIPRPLPPASLIRSRLEAYAEVPYVWGGNYAKGIPQLLERYPPRDRLVPWVEAAHTLAGVDCSGLLYEVTDGATPRNTSMMFTFGMAIDKPTRPLDLILMDGHVIVLLDERTTIESFDQAGGIVRRSLVERLDEVADKKRLVYRRFSNC